MSDFGMVDGGGGGGGGGYWEGTVEWMKGVRIGKFLGVRDFCTSRLMTLKKYMLN